MGKYRHWAVFNIESLEGLETLPMQLKEKSKGVVTPIDSILVNVADPDDKSEAFNSLSKMFPDYYVRVGVISKHDL